MKINRQIILHLFILIAVVLFFEFTNTDILFQDRLYLWDRNRWLVDASDPFLRLIFYTGLKKLIIIFGLMCLSALVLSLRINKYSIHRRFYIMVILSLILIPGTVSLFKHISNVYTPSEIERYGGDKPYVKVFEPYPNDFSQSKKGKGWPAGHASGGFALMIFYFAFKKRKYRLLGLSVGLILGWTMGLYQTFKGVHYISHTLITMEIAWIWGLIIWKTARNQVADLYHSNWRHEPYPIY